MKALLQSRKFLTAVFDLVICLILYFVVKYAAPSAAEDVKFIIAAIQPVFVLVIGGIAYEDGQAKGAITRLASYAAKLDETPL